MTGSLLQLVSVGSQDQYFIGNPQISHFKGVYRNYSNFSMENINVLFESGPKELNLTTKSTYIANIPFYGDMMSKILFEFDLPSVPTPPSGFKWINNIGTSIIDSIKFFIGNKLIEELTGEYIHCYYTTTLTTEKLNLYNDMVGNVSDLSPEKKRRIIVPIPFWFSKYEGVELPLVALKQTKVTVKLELKPVSKLYTEEPASDGRHTAPKSNIIPRWDSNANLSIDYIFLNDGESKIMEETEHQYLIERIQRQEDIGKVYNSTFELKLFNPIKEIFIVPKRDDIHLANQYSNYTNRSVNMTNSNTNIDNKYYTENIIEEMALYFNGGLRTLKHSYAYYHTVQPYLHHTNKLPPGVLMYSFAIHPEQYQPSGACNFTNFKTVQLELKLKDPGAMADAIEKKIKYDITIYASSYNILRIEKGNCNLIFTT